MKIVDLNLINNEIFTVKSVSTFIIEINAFYTQI